MESLEFALGFTVGNLETRPKIETYIQIVAKIKKKKTDYLENALFFVPIVFFAIFLQNLLFSYNRKKN